jgi:long-chain acyl-CoA synthetase
VKWFPRDVEEALCRQPGVRQAALIGKLNRSGELIPCAFITCQPGLELDLSALKQKIQGEVNYPLSQMSISVIEDFPMTPTGKIAKGELALQAGSTV